MLNKIITWWKSIDRRHPIDVAFDEIREKGQSEVENITNILDKDERFALVYKNHIYAGHYSFDVLDSNTGILYKKLRGEGVLNLIKSLK